MTIQLPETVQENIEQFHGRAWFLPILQDWLQNGDEQIFLLTGDPGTGKSMIITWLAGHGPLPEDEEKREQLAVLRKQVIAAHFLQANTRNFTPQAFAQAIANQLTERVSGFSDALKEVLADRIIIQTAQKVETIEPGGSVTGVTIGTLNLADLEDSVSFDRTFVQSLKKLYENGHDEPLLILVDALDEAWPDARGQQLVLLLAQLSDLPKKVRILATSRPDPRVTKHFRQAHQLDLINDAPENSADIYSFAQSWLINRNKLGEASASQLAKRIDEAAAGIFLHAFMVLRDIVPALQLPISDEEFQLPTRLSGLYHDFLTRELGQDEDRWYDELQPLFGLIAVAQGEGLTRQQLKELLGHDPLKNLRICRQYLSGELNDGPFRVFHKSLADYLLDDEDNTDYEIDAAEMHGCLASVHNLNTADWNTIDPYYLRYLPYHLAGAGWQADLKRLLLDFNFLQAKLEEGNINDLINDFNNLATQKRRDPTRLVQDGLKLSAHVLSFDAHQLAGQLVGRLKGIGRQELAALVRQAEGWRGAVWLCPLHANLTPPGGPLRRVLKGRAGGHAGTVRSLAITPDGKWAITAGNSSNDQTVRVWNLETGTCRHVFYDQAEGGGITPLAITPAAANAVTAFAGEVRLWDLDNGEIIATQAIDGATVSALALSPDARLVLLGASDGSLRLWRPEAQSMVELAGHEDLVAALAMSSDGRLACSLSSTTLKCWDLSTEKLVDSIQTSDQYSLTIWNPPAISFTDDGNAILFGSPLQSWVFEQGTLTLILPEAKGEEFLGISTGGSRALSTGDGQIVTVWDVPNGKRLFNLPRPETLLSVASLSGNGRHAVTADYEHDLRVWDVADGEQTRPGDAAAGDIEFVDFAEDPRMGIFRMQDGSFTVRTFEDESLPPVLDMQEALIAAWESRQRRLAMHHKQTYDSLWPSEDALPPSNIVIADHVRPLLRVSEDGLRAVSAGIVMGKYCDGEEPVAPHDVSESYDLTLWRLLEQPEAISLKGHSAPLRDLQITPDGRYAVSGGWGRIVRVWDLDAAAQRWAIQGHQGLVFAVAITPDGRWAASCAEDNTVKLWDLIIGQLTATYSSDTTLVNCQIAANGKMIVAQESSSSAGVQFHYLRVVT